MRTCKKYLLVILTTINCCCLNAQGELRYGLITKLEFNRAKIENEANKSVVKYQSPVISANGLYISQSINRRFFVDASVLLSRAKYQLDYRRAGSVFMDADIRFTELNINLNMILNPRAQKLRVFIFGGGQLLYRRWGQERFENDVIANTYWPSTRVMFQFGVGSVFPIGNGFYLQPFVGGRYAYEQQLVYDTNFNQTFVGCVLAYQIKGRVKDRYRGCPTDF
ncbi:MAG: hypothetical protein V4613_12355 [Bacteroidota bacterium]